MTVTAGDFFEGVPTISSDDASVTRGTTESHLVDVSRPPRPGGGGMCVGGRRRGWMNHHHHQMYE